MNKILKKCIAFLLISIIAFPIMPTIKAQAAAASNDPLGLKAEAAMLVDAGSGKILYQKNPDELLHPASMTKMMTEYLILDAIKKGSIKWDQKISISDYVFKVSHNKNLSNVWLRKDAQYTVKELYESMAIYSANGSTIALAELVAGSETNFIKMMNEKAAELGLKDYKFVNSTGLNNADLFGMQPEGTSPTDENVMSARAVATLAYRLLKDHPEVLQTSSITKKIFREGTPDANKMENWNWMLPGLVFGYEGVDGLKTGDTDAGGCSFTATAKRGNLRFISVVMKTASKTARFQETKRLLDYGFSNFSEKQIFPAGYRLPGMAEIPVVSGRQKKVGIAAKTPLSIAVKNGEENAYTPSIVLDSSMLKNGALSAPLKNGQTVGYLTANYKGSINYGYLTADGKSNEQVPVVTTAQVKKANWIILSFRTIGNFISNVFSKIKK